MKTLYLECAMGAAGDMLMSALSELIPDPEGFVREMNALGLPGVKIERQKAVRAGITGTHMAVTVDGQEEHSSDAEPGHDHHHEHEHDHHHEHDHDHEHHHEHHHGHEHEHEHHHDHDHDHEHEEHDHHEHEEHDHDHESHGHIHHHHHHHDDGCSCGHDHDADEIFESWGAETPRKYTEEEVTGALAGLDEGEKYGIVLRAKGIVPCTDGSWIHFDYVPGEQNIRRGPAGITGRLCVIGSELKEHDLDHLFCLD